MEEMLIIPDVHGRTFWKEPCENWKGKIIFLGDYFDPYPQELITDEMAYINAIELFSFIEKNSDRVIALLGNHDLHYLSSDFAESTRYSFEYAPKIRELFNKYIKYFRLAYETNNILFTHAGITESWGAAFENSEFNNPTKPISENLNYLLKKLLEGDYNAISLLSWVGRTRGGWNLSGSCVWADIIETLYCNKYNPDITQIVGHSQVKEIFTTDELKKLAGITNYDNSFIYTDCHKACILTKEGKVTYYE